MRTQVGARLKPNLCWADDRPPPASALACRSVVHYAFLARLARQRILDPLVPKPRLMCLPALVLVHQHRVGREFGSVYRRIFFRRVFVFVVLRIFFRYLVILAAFDRRPRRSPKRSFSISSARQSKYSIVAGRALSRLFFMDSIARRKRDDVAR